MSNVAYSMRRVNTRPARPRQAARLPATERARGLCRGGRKIRRDSRSKRRTCKDRHHIGCFFSPALQYDIAISALPYCVRLIKTAKRLRLGNWEGSTRPVIDHPQSKRSAYQTSVSTRLHCEAVRRTRASVLVDSEACIAHERKHTTHYDGRWRTLKAHQRQPLPP